MPDRRERPWLCSVAEVVEVFETDASDGLSDADAANRLASVGFNELIDGRTRSGWAILVAQFANTMTVVLAAAAAVTGVIGDVTDTVVIGVIVVLNAVVGFAQEHRAEQAMSALKRLASDSAQVVREGRLVTIPSSEVVPGDLVHLSTGDVVPADLRLSVVHGLQVNEASLTGESAPVAKLTETLTAAGSVVVADRRNMAFKGTATTNGRSEGIVVATGMATELGRIAALIQAHPTKRTPLQARLADLGQRLALAAGAVCVVVFAVGLLRGETVERMFLTAVSLAVAAIPEGLPAVVTVSLAIGARRMADHHAIVRRLAAVETLGSVSVICSDKTGTLTQNRMVVERVWTPTASYTVSGDGYRPAGTVTGPMDPAGDPDLRRVGRIGVACNDASLHPPNGDDPSWHATGDPTEAALLALAGRLDLDAEALRRAAPRQAEIGFDANRRRMTTVQRTEGKWWVAVKGALDAIAPLCRPEDRTALERAHDAADSWAAEGFRLLALADRDLPALPRPLEQAEQGLRLAGFVAIADPPRLDAAAAIAKCRSAGIRPILVTGDHPRTAEAIARRLGVLTDGAIITGAEMDLLDDVSLAALVDRTQVFARTNPEQKLRIVDALKASGATVAMTGDGVNDAPALRRADIGVAMGITGTDVAKEAADMVLTDDNFSTIVLAVEEGRRIYDNIRRFVRYLLSTNSGEILVMFLAPLAGLPIPLLPVQILWINLITDGLPAVALGLEPAEADTMQRPPRPPDESILGRGLWQQAIWVGLIMAATTIAIEAVADDNRWPWQTMVFTTLAFLQLGSAVAARSERQSSLKLRWRTNPWLAVALAVTVAAQLLVVYLPTLQAVFHTTALSVGQLAIVLAGSTTAFVAIEADKARRRRTHTSDSAVTVHMSDRR